MGTENAGHTIYNKRVLKIGFSRNYKIFLKNEIKNKIFKMK